MSQLKILIGKKIKGLTHEISWTIPLQQPNDPEVFDLYLQLQFEGNYVLNICNNHCLENVLSLQEFENEILSGVEESDSEIVFSFEKKRIKVDMSDSGFTGPEAMSLNGPNNLIVVWN